MRQGPQNHKQRNRNRNRKGPNPLTRSYESNGGDVKIRGTALHVAEKYVQLARDAQASGDRVAAENYLQHAEHYYRIVAAAQAQMQPQQMPPNFRPEDEGDEEDDRDEGFAGNGSFGFRQGYPQSGGQQGGNPQGGAPQGGGQQNYGGQAYSGGQTGGNEPQPFTNGNAPSYNGEPSVNEGQGQGGGDERGGFRQRRRRPYRDQQGNRGPNPQAGPDVAGGDGGVEE